MGKQWKITADCEERDARGWHGWMASPTQWTWVWVDSSNWWRTGRPGVLPFMGSQSRTRHWTNWTGRKYAILLLSRFQRLPFHLEFLRYYKVKKKWVKWTVGLIQKRNWHVLDFSLIESDHVKKWTVGPLPKGVKHLNLRTWWTNYVKNLKVGQPASMRAQSVSCVQLFVAPMDCSIHRILQATILEWGAISFSRGSSQHRDRTQVSCIIDRFVTIWAKWSKALLKPGSSVTWEWFSCEEQEIYSHLTFKGMSWLLLTGLIQG